MSSMELETPCQYTVEEMNAMLDEAEKDMDAGNGIPSKEVFREIEQKYPFLTED